MTACSIPRYAFVMVVAAACAYGPASAQGRLTVSGYGEVHYNNATNEVAVFDLHRLVLGWGYRFTDNVGFAAELDFEHAFTEPEVEFAQVDFFGRDALSFRGGVLLMPVGPLNEYHEPPLYYSVERPHVEKYVIPTTWSEPGAGMYGTLAGGNVGYRAYVVAGLDASEFRANDGIRKGRQKAAEAKADDLAGVVRVEWSPSLKLSVGASAYAGGAAHGNPALGEAAVALGVADMRLELFGFEIRGLYAHAFVNDADSISVNNKSGTTVGEEIVGWNIEVAFRVLGALGRRGNDDLILFVRYEDFDTQYRVPHGFARDPAYHRMVLSGGASYMPLSRVAVKADVERWETENGSRWEQYNVGLAWMFAQ